MPRIPEAIASAVESSGGRVLRTQGPDGFEAAFASKPIADCIAAFYAGAFATYDDFLAELARVAGSAPGQTDGP